MNNSFKKFVKDKKVSSLSLDKYKKSKDNLLLPKQPKFTGSSPMVIEERQLNISTISVFDRLMMDRIIFLGEEIDDYIANIINAQLLFLDTYGDNQDDPIWLYINSPGGDCYSGLAIYDTMNALGAKVYTCVMGAACSMAFILAIAGEKKHRYALKHSRLMMHQPLGNPGYSQATDLEIANREMQNIKNDMSEIIALHTKKDKEIIKMDMERDYYMRGQEAIDYGAIDKILIKTR